MPVSRRDVLRSIASLPLFAQAGFAAQRGPALSRPPLSMTLTGQALMKHPLCDMPYDGFADIVAEIQRGDLAFTDLEVAIQTPRSGAPTRNNSFLHATSPVVLECLRDMGFDLLALSNNHAWDLGTAGILATRDAVADAGFAHAGTGANLDEASAAGTWDGAARVALVSMASGKIVEGGAATETRPGVNEVRLSDDDVVEPDDHHRIMSSIEKAAIESDYVIAYLHNHQWRGDMTVTRTWVREFAKDCAAAGADVFASHGAPLLHGIEIFKGKPLMYGLGSLVFHSHTEPGYYLPEVWQSAIVHLDFDADGLKQLTAVPIALNEIGDNATHHLETRGRPRIASGDKGAYILERLRQRSAELGTELTIDGGRLLLGR